MLHLLCEFTKLWISPPRAFAAPKPSKDFRVVHQLEPIDAIVYTAFAFQIAEDVEKARPPELAKIACSYRFSLGEGNFFSGGSGYGHFIEQTENLADKYKHILVTDITDYYNQINLHRLNNAVEHANPALKSVGDDIEDFLSKLNGKASQGVPVGPAASIVMAEAVLMDVDNYLENQGVVHTRYVDDFRIFDDSADKLQRVQQGLTLYLYENHRLVLSGPKTKITEATSYVDKKLHNPYAEEKFALFESLEMFNPYTEEVEEVEFEVEDEEVLLVAKVCQIIDKILEFQSLDIGLARSAIRRAKRHKIKDIVHQLLDNIQLFSPVINDIVLYLEEVADDQVENELEPKFVSIIKSPIFDLDLVRFWIEWYLAGHLNYLENPDILRAIRSTPHFTNRARAAMTAKDLA